ncbi:hypothetical protein A2U01_0047032, partial [Trifolium medium]|nr:hypothetical protein [Trifolium medium]
VSVVQPRRNHDSRRPEPHSRTGGEKLDGDRSLVPRVGKDDKEHNPNRYVSFYVTNFPDDISLFHLKRGFEVCGILEDVYVAKKRNVHGNAFGFVMFSGVKNRAKLLKALNDVWFGHYRVRANFALFNRFDTAESRSLEMTTGGMCLRA